MPAERTPQITVNRTKIARLATKAPCVFRVGPFFPDVYAPRAQVRLVRVAGKKPEQLFRNPAERDSLRSDDWKAVSEIEARLKSEVRDRADTGAVLMLSAVFEN